MFLEPVFIDDVCEFSSIFFANKEKAADMPCIQEYMAYFNGFIS